MLKPVDLIIISYPKCGRTWLRVLLGKVLCIHYGFDEEYLVNTYLLTELAGLRRLEYGHDATDLALKKKWWENEADKSGYRDIDVIFLIRDPKDVLVSSFFHATKRNQAFDGTLGEFIRSDEFGIRKILVFWQTWLASQTVPRSFELLRYEELHRDPFGTVRFILERIGANEISDSEVRAAVNFADFQNLKKLEREGWFEVPFLRPGDLDDEESYKVRRGVVGGYKDYLTKDDICYIDAVIDEVGLPFGPFR
jgi:hypothetical protein